MTAEIPLLTGDRIPVDGTALQCRLAEAAIDLFYERGSRATTVRDITAACGLTPGALYNHFSSKEQLLYVLVRDIHWLVDVHLAAVVERAGADAASRLSAAVRFLVLNAAGHKKQSRVANREFTTLQGVQRQEVRAIRRLMRDRLTSILLAGAEEGAFTLVGGPDRAAATLTAATISSMCLQISDWTLQNYPLSNDELQERYAQMALRLAGWRPA